MCHEKKLDDGFSKVFQNEALLFDVTVVLNIGASQEPVSELFVWKVIQTLFH